MNELSDYIAWKKPLLREPDGVTKHYEIYEKFGEYINSIIKTGNLPEQIAQFTDEFLNTIIFNIANSILNTDYNQIEQDEIKIINLYINSFCDLGIYGAVSHDKSALSLLSLLVTKNNKPFFQENNKKNPHSNFLKKLYSKGAIQAFQYSIESSQNIELLSLVLELTSSISKYDPFFAEQAFFDISINAINRIISLNKEIVSVKFLCLSLDSIQKFIPYFDDAYIYFVQTVLSILKIFITSENLEQRSNALSQFLKYAKEPLSMKEVVHFFSVKNRFSIFASVNLHYSISSKIGELMSIIISNSPTIGKPGIINEIWSQYASIKKASFELSTFYDTFICLGCHLKSNLFDEFINAVLGGKPSFPWFEMIDKLSTMLSKRKEMKETFRRIRQKLWSIFDSFEDDNNQILSFRENAKNSLIHMIGFNADESDLKRVENLREIDPKFFYMLLNSFLENGNCIIDDKTASELLISLLNDLSPTNHSSIMINDIKQLCNLCSQLSDKQLNLLMDSIEYFPDFFDYMSQLREISALKTKNVIFIASKIKPQFINREFYTFLKGFINSTNQFNGCITKLPINYEDLIWKFALIDSPVRTNFAKFLCRIYQMNDGKKLTDANLNQIFLKNWKKNFTENVKIDNLLSLLWIFIDMYESNIYRDVNVFNMPLSIERTVDIFTVKVQCQKPEFSINLKYPVNYTIEAVVEELYEKYNKLNGINGMNVYIQGTAVKRSAAIKDLVEDKNSISIELDADDEILIPHPYHIRTEIPSRIIIKKNWHTKYFEPLLKEGKEKAYEIIKLLPSNSKNLNIEDQLNNKENSKIVFESILDIHYPYLFAYHFLLIYFSTLTNNVLLKLLVEKGIIDYLLSLIVSFEAEEIFIEICDIFNYFVVNIIKIYQFPKNVRNEMIFTLLKLAEKGFNLKSMKMTFDQLLIYNQGELRFESFPLIRLLFHSNVEVQTFAMNVFKDINIDLNEYLDILRNHKDKINETFIQSLAHHITLMIDQDIIYEITDIIMELQNQPDNQNGNFLQASLILFHRFLEFKFLNYEKRQNVLQLIIQRLITTEFLDTDLIAFEAATKCLSLLACTEAYTLHKVLDELHSNRKPFTEFSIDGNKCSISNTGRVGLQRIGNTCYFNTIMQMLFAIKPIRNIIMSYDGDDNFLKEFSKLFILMKKMKARSINTENILEYLTYSDGNKIDISIQQDAAEFLQIIINKNEDVEKLFRGKSVDIYEGSGFRYEKEELFVILDLDVQNIPSLYESFESFSKDVYLTGSNQFIDEKTGKKIDVKKYTKIKEAPPFLIIHLKRFESIDLENIGAKIDDIFEIPFEFDISPFSTQNFPIYRLTGVIVHWGTALNGHYTCLSLTKNGWVKFDDVNSTFIDQKEVNKLIQGGTNQGNAYILFFSMENNVNYSKIEIRPELLQYADKMNEINNNKRLFCSIEYFNIINTLNNLVQLDYHDVVLRYSVDSLPFMEIRNQNKPLFNSFYSNLLKKSKLQNIMLVEKFRFLDYSINFLKDDLLLCPYQFIRKQTADLILSNLDEKGNPYQFLIIIFDMVEACLQNATQFDQVFYLIYSILNEFNELKENMRIQNILYNLLENVLIPFISSNPSFSDIDMTYILEIVNMYNVFKKLNINNFIHFLDQLFLSDTSIDSIVCFVKLAFNENEMQINKFIKDNISQIPVQKFIPFYFFFDPNKAIQTTFNILENKHLKVSPIRNPDEFDIVCIFADLLSKCQSLSKYFIKKASMKIWIPRLLLNIKSSKIRLVSLSIFSYLVPHANLKKWNFSIEGNDVFPHIKIPFDLKFASIKDSTKLNVCLSKLCSKVLAFMMGDDITVTIHDIFVDNSDKYIDDDICVQYFQVIEELLMIVTDEIDLKKFESFTSLYNDILKYIKNPFSGSLIHFLILMSKFDGIKISKTSLESGLAEIKSFSKYINDESHSKRFIEFLTYYFDLSSNFEPSKTFLNKFFTYYVFSPEMTSEWTPIFKYIKTILFNAAQSVNEQFINHIVQIVDKNYKNFANNNFSSLLFLLNQIVKTLKIIDKGSNIKVNMPTLSYLRIAFEKPQYWSINKIIKKACELNNRNFDKNDIQAIIKKYKYEIDDENINLLKSFINNGSGDNSANEQENEEEEEEEEQKENNNSIQTDNNSNTPTDIKSNNLFSSTSYGSFSESSDN